MPCDSITTQSVNLSNAIGSILADSLKAAGYHIDSISSETYIWCYKGPVSIAWKKGKGLEVNSADPQEVIKQVTKAYSARAVTWAAGRAGWTVKQTADNQLTVTRR